ncbi:SERTA domain-containing protein 3 isoform X1 [Hippoglossus hippoglossus]|uniref:SERTA domain-containing protein 3 isoform X1 n=1 Tax=Hippoglossus hippoglossus TaxID=8267 RepID=UPI00148E7F25|nr:SERTA domain-containing protein 3 isoform X1 [Hippoglossus hippoglossus]XP_034461017.1 SERTA domain-containing protein 3 isoform X1 [Hippoglossus hippoglossus]
MIMKGQKRKFPPEDVEVSDRSSLTWESQRQFVFSVSLSKYQRGQELPEPSLRRSVLIANTLRQISLEACGAPSVEVSPGGSSSELQAQEEEESIFTGVPSARHQPAEAVINGHSALSTGPVVSSGYSSSCVTSRCPASCHSYTSNVPLSLGDEDEDWGSMTTDPDFSLSAAISSILSALDSTIDGSPQAAPRSPLRSLENLSRSPEGSAAWVKQGVRGYGGGSWEPQEECRVRDSNVEVMWSSYLSDLTVEDLFQDIDTSLLERDMGVLGLRGSGGGFPAGEDLLRYLPPFSPSSHPFSLSLNQNLKCLPSFSSFSPMSSSSSSSPSLSSPPSSLFSGHNHAREGLELEHLMEILVES